MNWQVEFTPRAIKELKKMDKPTSAMLLGWVRKNLDGCDNPRLHGKGLTGPKSGQWRYRVGDYRLICDLNDHKIVVVVLAVGHRSDIYKK